MAEDKKSNFAKTLIKSKFKKRRKVAKKKADRRKVTFQGKSIMMLAGKNDSDEELFSRQKLLKKAKSSLKNAKKFKDKLRLKTEIARLKGKIVENIEKSQSNKKTQK